MLPSGPVQAISRRRSGSILLVLGSVLCLNSANAQESQRGSLFQRPPGESGLSSGSGTSLRAPGSTNESAGPLGSGQGPLNSLPGLGGAVPSDLLQPRPQGTGEPRRDPLDPLRGPILRPDQMSGRPPAAALPEPRTGASGAGARQSGEGDHRSSSRASAAPTDPLGGLLSDSEKLLKFSAPNSDPLAPDARMKSGDDSNTFRQNRNPIPSPGLATPDLLSTNPGALALPMSPLPTTLMPNATTKASNLGLEISTSTGSEAKSGPASRPPPHNFGGGASDDQSSRRLKQQFTIVERVKQMLVSVLQQPLSYVVLLGMIGYVIVARLRRL